MNRNKKINTNQHQVVNFSNRLITLMFIMAVFYMPAQYVVSDDFGRLFTTPQERSILEKKRYTKSVEVETPKIVFEEPVMEKEEPEIGGITVKGLVYREHGKSTAWVNSGNTYEGNLGNQYIQIDAKNIDPDKIEIEIPLNETRVNLKTGQTYDPEAGKVNDLEYQ